MDNITENNYNKDNGSEEPLPPVYSYSPSVIMGKVGFCLGAVSFLIPAGVLVYGLIASTTQFLFMFFVVSILIFPLIAAAGLIVSITAARNFGYHKDRKSQSKRNERNWGKYGIIISSSSAAGHFIAFAAVLYNACNF